MNTKQMKAAMAKVAPKKAAAVDSDGFNIITATAEVIGATPSVVRKHTGKFFDAMSTSYKYNEMVRKGEL